LRQRLRFSTMFFSSGNRSKGTDAVNMTCLSLMIERISLLKKAESIRDSNMVFFK
jgi:hypothetical protein